MYWSLEYINKPYNLDSFKQTYPSLRSERYRFNHDMTLKGSQIFNQRAQRYVAHRKLNISLRYI